MESIFEVNKAALRLPSCCIATTPQTQNAVQVVAHRIFSISAPSVVSMNSR